MASGYIVSGRGDLDTIFAPRFTPAGGNVGYAVGGVDLAQRYEQIGGSTPVAATGFKTSGADLSTRFAGIVATTSTTTSMVAGQHTSTLTFYGLTADTNNGSIIAGSRNPTTHAGYSIVLIEQIWTGSFWTFRVGFFSPAGPPPYTAALLKRVRFVDRNSVARTYRTQFDSPSDVPNIAAAGNTRTIQWATSPADQLFTVGNTYSISFEV